MDSQIGKYTKTNQFSILHFYFILGNIVIISTVTPVGKCPEKEKNGGKPIYHFFLN